MPASPPSVTRVWTAAAVVVCAAVITTPLGAQEPSRATRPRVLFLTHSAGFTHAVVERIERGKLALAERELRAAAEPHFELVASQDCGELAPQRLRRYDAVLFYTTGELPVPDDHVAHLVDWVRAGGAFCGVHSATDTWYEQPAYGELIGGWFDGHPWHEEVGVVVDAPGHPIVAHRAGGFTIHDEIYQFRDWSREDKTVLLALDPETVDIERGARADRDYALAWCRDFGSGRMFYHALGHRHAVWADAGFQRTLLQGLRWTLDADDAFARPPEGATVLFDGSSTDAFTNQDGGPVGWRVADGALEVVPGSGSIVTRQEYRDFVLHAGFRVPVEDGPQGQRKGNSGVYLQRRYEVQILDSFGREPDTAGCGSLYRQRRPDVNAARAPGTWQDYWLRFRAPRFDADGTKTENARLTLWWNGVLVHDDVEVPSKTGAGRPEGSAPGPILLQDHDHPVRFRNIWILPD